MSIFIVVVFSNFVQPSIIAWWILFLAQFSILDSFSVAITSVQIKISIQNDKWKHNELCWFRCQQWKSIQHAKFTCQMSWNGNNNKKYSNCMRIVSLGIALFKFWLFFPRFLLMNRGAQCTLIKRVYFLISGVTSFFVGPKNKHRLLDAILVQMQNATFRWLVISSKDFFLFGKLLFFRWTVFVFFLMVTCNAIHDTINFKMRNSFLESFSCHTIGNYKVSARPVGRLTYENSCNCSIITSLSDFQ